MTTLTAEQRRIVEWDEGPAVVIAGAGTGKTRVIVERVKHLLESRPDLLPEQILVLTYNVKAAAELRSRLEQAVGLATAARMEIGNFHSFCQGILSEVEGVPDPASRFCVDNDVRMSAEARSVRRRSGSPPRSASPILGGTPRAKSHASE